MLIAAAALFSASIAELYLCHWAVLAFTAVLAAAAIVWLRWTIQLGLLQEAEEKPIGPPIECPSCRHETPAHTFCGNCGVRLRALPTPRSPHGTAPPGRARMRGGVKLALFGAIGAAAVGIAAVVIALNRPSHPAPQCEPGVPCATPPESPIALPHTAAAVFKSGVKWTSDLGPSLFYPKHWDVVASGKRSLVVQGQNGSGLFVVLAVFVVPSSQTPASALAARLQSERNGSFLGVDGDGSAKHVILSPEIGYVHGLAGCTTRPSTSRRARPSRSSSPSWRRATAATGVIEGITNEGDRGGSASSPFPAFQAVDASLESFTWGAPPT